MREWGVGMYQVLRVIPLLLAAVVVVWTSTASGAVIAVNPVRVHLSDEKRSELLEVSNSGTQAARFQITAYAWRQSADEDMILTPTNDLVFFPSLFSIAAGGSRLIRVASTAMDARTEKAYRLIVEELPQGAAPSGGVQVLTRMNLPVFVQTRGATAKPALDAQLQHRLLSVVLRNHGNTYFKGADVRIVARASDGRSLFEKSIPAWYLLAGARKSYELAMPPDVCEKLETVTIVLRTDEGTVRKVLNVTPSLACSG